MRRDLGPSNGNDGKCKDEALPNLLSSGKEAVPTPRREKFRHLFGKPRDSNRCFHSIQLQNKTRKNAAPHYMEKVRRTQGLIGQKPFALKVLIVYFRTSS